MAILHSPADPPIPLERRTFARPEWLLALALTLVLVAAWTVRDLPALSAGRLPDNDDLMRLAQVRDWISGQAFSDLTQHRLGPDGGESMHWSRLADLGPAMLILILAPLMGGEAAELWMLVLYPAGLLLLTLLAMASVARRLGGDGAEPIAVVLGALAFPSVSLFLPGRIDHHGLQILLMLLLAGALVAPPSLTSGIRAGAVAALSLAVGLETAPEIVAAMAALFLLWVLNDRSEDGRAAGFALGLGGVTALLLLAARPEIWPDQWCDGMTPASTQAILTATLCWAVLAGVGRRLSSGWGRLVAGGAIALAGLLVTVRTGTVCFTGPYGALDPLLARLFMDRVGEAQSLFDQERIGTAVAYGGLCVAGTLAAVHRVIGRGLRSPEWLALTVFLLLGVAAALLQIRVAYVMAMIAALPLAVLIADLRHRSSPAIIVLAWIAATGFSYQAVGVVLDRAGAALATDLRTRTAACLADEGFTRIARLEPGRFMAPIDLGAPLIGRTPHVATAAPYHRNNAGNLAMYRFFLAPPERAQAIAAQWDVHYVALCPSSFDEIDLGREGPGGLALALKSGHVPGWLDEVDVGAGTLRVWRVRRPL